MTKNTPRRHVRLRTAFSLTICLCLLCWWLVSFRKSVSPSSASGMASDVEDRRLHASATLLAECNRARNRKVEIAVEVVDQLARPVAGAKVHFESDRWVGAADDYLRPEGRPRAVAAAQAVTDERGRAIFQSEASFVRVSAIEHPGILDHPWNHLELFGLSIFDLSNGKCPLGQPVTLSRRLVVCSLLEAGHARALRQLDFTVRPDAPVRLTWLWDRHILVAKKLTSQPGGPRFWPLEIRQLSATVRPNIISAELRSRNGKLRAFPRAAADQAAGLSQSSETLRFEVSCQNDYETRFVYNSTDGGSMLVGTLSARQYHGGVQISLTDVHAVEVTGKR